MESASSISGQVLATVEHWAELSYMIINPSLQFHWQPGEFAASKRMCWNTCPVSGGRQACGLRGPTGSA
jgi:hypothetical protein